MDCDYEFVLKTTDKIRVGDEITITAIRLNSTGEIRKKLGV